jgi:uncharacterized protein YjbJ (UPF0337 family)
MSDETREGDHDVSRGKLEETIGKVAGNDELETEGRVHQAEGELKRGLGEARADVSDAADTARDVLNG